MWLEDVSGKVPFIPYQWQEMKASFMVHFFDFCGTLPLGTFATEEHSTEVMLDSIFV